MSAGQFLSRASERLNPILVKEVRQSLRGRYFRILFWSTLSVATLVSLGVVASAASDNRVAEIGTTMFMWVFGILAAAVHCFVPYSAFLATGAEWDENTWDLLVISNLRPRHLVAGKLLSAVIQAVLFYSAFGPLLVFAFLLNGIDLLSLAVLLPGSLVTCVTLSLVGIAVSSLARVRFLRVILMAAFAAALVFTTIATIFMAGGIVFRPDMLRDDDILIVLGAYSGIAAAVSAVAYAIACARFAHEEENRSTALRVISVGLVLFAIPWSIWFARALNFPTAAWGCQFAVAAIDLPLLLVFLTERDAMGRRVTKRVPRNRLAALLATPFLPGGGRGVLLFALQFALAMAAVAIVYAFGGPSAAVRDYGRAWAILAVAYGFLWLYFGPISGVGALITQSPRARGAIRLTALLLVPLSILLPVLIGMFLNFRRWMEFDHPFNPFQQIGTLASSSSSHSVSLSVSIAVLVLGGSLGLILNVPRIFRGVREVLGASRARREAARAPIAIAAAAPAEAASGAAAER